MKTLAFLLIVSTLISACAHQTPAKTHTKSSPFLWQNASIYFLLTDRFHNGKPESDQNFNRKQDGAVLRSFEGGDIAGITQKIKSGYFNQLGVNAIWLTPQVEQVRGFTDEGTGKTYAYHGYWAADWTSIDPNFGTMEDMRDFVDTAHRHGIRVLLDVVMNHTGPVMDTDPQWPDEWVRTEPKCQFKNRETTVTCTLVENLPDIRTEDLSPVSLPPRLVEKWKQEQRYQQEIQELDAFFTRTQLPRAPRYYLLKWHLDWIRDFGVDGFRVDTTKHVEPEVWQELRTHATREFELWKTNNPDKKLDDTPFYLTGEVYSYNIQSGKHFDLGEGEEEDFYQDAFDSLINFSLRSDERHYDEVFQEYSDILNTGELSQYSIVNYMSSHDDGHPFDKDRKRPFEAATRLMLTPGAVQIYYGDETARELEVAGSNGDANLRSTMNWQALENNLQKHDYRIKDVLEHWRKLGKFRQAHPAVGAGEHRKIQASPYTFSRTLNRYGVTDTVVVALDLNPENAHSIVVGDVFEEGTRVRDYYSGNYATVKGGRVEVMTPYTLVLLGVES